MKPKNLTLILLLLSIFAFGQEKKIDSLRNVLKKNPKNFYLQKEIIGEFIGTGDVENLTNEIEIAKNSLKFNSDFHNYFKINDVFILLLNNDYIKADKKLNFYDKIIDYSKLYNTKTLMLYFKGVVANKIGKHKLAENYFLQSFKNIEEHKLDKKHFLSIYNYYATSLLRLGEYEKALSQFYGILKIMPYNQKFNIYTNLGICYYNLKQLNHSEKYYKLSLKNADLYSKPNCAANLAILYMEKNDYEKAEETIKEVDFKTFSSIDSSAVFNVLGEIEQHKKNYNKAISNFNIVIKIDARQDKNADLANDYLAIGNLYKEVKNYKSADYYLNNSYKLLKEFDDKNAEKRVLESLIDLDFSKTNNIKSKKHFQHFLTLSDSLNSETVQINANLLETKYQTAQKEAQIKTQQLQIQQAKNKQNIGIGVIGILGLLTVGGFLWFKNKQKTTALQNQNTELSLQQNLNLMQLDNLNKQLDPHEIKNILASISPEIQRKAPEAYDKMTKLLNITRASLSSGSITDSIENQLQQIEDYLSLEKTVLAVPLSYSINNSIANNKQIPRLLLKNLVENSIKHGIKNKKEGGNIAVLITENNNQINIVVDDTGVGRQQAISLDSGIGTSTYINLFSTLNKKNTAKASFEITDKQEGTTVTVVIPEDYKYV